jgi:hypothetical protein
MICLCVKIPLIVLFMSEPALLVRSNRFQKRPVESRTPADRGVRSSTCHQHKPMRFGVPTSSSDTRRYVPQVSKSDATFPYPYPSPSFHPHAARPGVRRVPSSYSSDYTDIEYVSHSTDPESDPESDSSSAASRSSVSSDSFCCAS